MNRPASILLLILLLFNSFAIITTPLTARASAVNVSQVTEYHDIWVCAQEGCMPNAPGDKNLTAPNGDLYDITLGNTSELIVYFNLSVLSEAGIDLGSVYLAISPGLPKIAFLTSRTNPKTISLLVNGFYDSDPYINTTFVEYVSITRVSADLSMAKIKFKTLKGIFLETADSSPGPNDNPPTYVEDLYGVGLSFVVEDITPDRAESDNVFTMYEVPNVDAQLQSTDISITVTNDVIKKYHDTIIVVDYSVLFDKVNDLLNSYGLVDIIGTVNLTRSDIYTEVYMYNLYNTSERHLLVYGNDLGWTTDGGPYFSTVSAYTDSDEKILYVDADDLLDFAPTEISAEEYLTSHYGFYVFINFSYAVLNCTFSLNITFDLEADSATASGTKKILKVKASEEVTEIPDLWADPAELNPNDNLTIVLHHLPEDADITKVVLNRSGYVIEIPKDELTITYLGDGDFEVNLTIPDGEWGGADTEVKVIVDTTRYVNEHPDCYVEYIAVYPYIITYIITNETAFAEENATGYNATFIFGNKTAPGDYVMVKGFGFITPTSEGEELTSYVKAFVDSNRILVLHAMDKGNGSIIVLLKMNYTTGGVVPPGTYTLNISVDPVHNYATAGLEVAIEDKLKKMFIDPVPFYNGTLYKIYHIKLTDPFQLYYPLIGSEPGDHFDWAHIPSWFNHSFEFISFPDTSVDIDLRNKDYSIDFSWLTLSLTHGYGLWHTGNALVDQYLPYGDYTWLVNGEEPKAIDGRTIFYVRIQIDIDYDSPITDRVGCRGQNITICAIGLPPNEDVNVTIQYTVYANGTNYYSIYPGLTREYWEGEFNVTITSDENGTGCVEFNTTDYYPTDYVTNATHEVAIKKGWVGTNVKEYLFFEFNATITGVSNETDSFELKTHDTQLDFSMIFHVHILYNITVIEHVTVTVPRENATITVPEVLLPGDTVTVQVFIHKKSVYDAYVDPASLLEISDVTIDGYMFWEAWVRLVDPLTNTPVLTVYGNSTPSSHPEWLIAEDVDGDGELEVWWAIPVDTSPLGLVGVDKTYRVDVRIRWRFANYSLTPEINVSDELCHIYMNYTSFIPFNVSETYWYIGGDHQLVTILGILEWKLDKIINDTVWLKAKVNDTYNYLTINITQFLEYINNTVVEIRGDVAIIKADVAIIKANVSTLIDLAREAHVKLDLILGNLTVIEYKIENVNETIHLRLDEINATLEEILWWLQDIKYELEAYYAELEWKLDEINETLHVMNDTLLWKLDAINESITLRIIMAKEQLEELIKAVNETIFRRLDRLEGSIEAYIDDKVVYIEGLLHEVVHNITTNVTIEIHNARDEVITKLEDILTNLTIQLTTLKNDLNASITYYGDTLIAKIESTNTSLHLVIRECCMNLTNLIKAVNTTILDRLDDMESSLEAYIDMKAYELEICITDAANDVKENITIEIGEAKDDILKAIEDMLTRITSRLDMLEEHINASIEIAKDETILFINDSKNAIIARIDSCCTELKDLIITKASDILARLDVLEANVVANITAAKNDLDILIRTVNSTLYAKIEDEADRIVGILNNVYTSLSDKLDNVNASISALITYYGDMLELKLDYINTTLHGVNATLYFKIESATASILNAINNMHTDLLNKLYELGNNLTVLINDRSAEIKVLVENKASEIVSNLSLKIDDASNNIISELKAFVSAKISEVIGNITDLKENVSITIKAYADMFEAKLDSINSTIHVKLDNYYTALRDLLIAINTSIFNRLDELETDLTLLVNEKTAYLEGVIYNVRDEILTNLTIEIHDAREDIVSELTSYATQILNRIDLAESNVVANITSYGDRIVADIASANATIHLKIEECCTELKDLITTKASDILTRIAELQDNVTITIKTYADMFEAKIDSVNSTIHLKLDNYYSALMSFLTSMNASLFSRLDELETDLTLLINEKTAYLEGVIYNVRDEILTNVTIELTNAKEEILAALEASTLAILARLDELESNVIANITYYAGVLEADIISTNISLHAKLDAYYVSLVDLLLAINESIFSRLDELEGNLVAFIEYETSRLEGDLYDVEDNIIYELTIEIDNAREELSSLITTESMAIQSLITLKADELKAFVNESRLEILASINDAKLTILTRLDHLEIVLNDTRATIMTELFSIETTLDNIIDLINTAADELGVKVDSLSEFVGDVNESIYGLVLTVGDNIKVTITGKADDIMNLVSSSSDELKSLIGEKASDLESLVGDKFSDLSDLVTSKTDELSSALDTAKSDLETLITDKFSELSGKLDDTKTALSSDISSAQTSLSSRLDEKSDDVSQKVDSVDSKLVTYSLVTLILLVVVIGLVGYSVIAFRRG